MLESVVCMGMLTSFGRIKQKYTYRLRQTMYRLEYAQSRQKIHCSLTVAVFFVSAAYFLDFGKFQSKAPVSVPVPYFPDFGKLKTKAQSRATWKHSVSPKSYQSIHFHRNDQNDYMGWG